MIDAMAGGIIISASILAADFTQLGESIRAAEAAGADWIHIDVMDGHFVPNLSLGPRHVRACRGVTSLPLDVHLMIEAPDHYLAEFVRAGADSISVHVEACTHLHRTLQAIRELGANAGVALNPGTPEQAIQEVLPLADLVLVMSVNPGFSGQAFIETTLPKIGRIREMLDAAKSPAHLQVDGGINPVTAAKVRQAGATAIAAASSIFKHAEGIEAGVQSLRSAMEPSPA